MKGKIFNAQEVQAIIAGLKVQFKEACKRQPQGEIEKPYVLRQAGITEYNYPFGKIPYQVGQKIFVKEKFAYIQNPEDCARESEPCEIHYKSDYDAEGFDKQDIEAVGAEFLSASKMLEWASRLTLQIKEIGVEKDNDLWVWCINFEVVNANK